MLLPSAMPCDILTAAATRPQRPRLPIFASYQPTPQQTSTSSPSGIFASCRALQSILGGQAFIQTPAPEILTEQSISDDLRSPFMMQSQSPPCLVKPSRGANKRTRKEFEDEDKENTPLYSATSMSVDRDLFQTPKRQRRTPLDVPRGLAPADFEDLNTPRQVCVPPRDENIQMPQRETLSEPQSACGLELQPSQESQHTQSPIATRTRRRSSNKGSRPIPPLSDEVDDQRGDPYWSPTDDRRLVEAVLSKLSLSKRDWNDCAKQLGKDKDSLGRRWRLLIGEGNIGIRRGVGRQGRTDLDIQSW